MPIVNSTHVVGVTQADSRSYVTESHEDHVGAFHRREYLAVSGADYVAIRTAAAAKIEVALADDEVARNLSAGTFSTVHLTVAQHVARIRELYRSLSGVELAVLARWIIARVQDGSFTEAQLQSAFGLTQQQYDALKARMIALRDHWNAVNAAQGE